MAFEEAKEEVQRLLLESVALRLRADVSVGHPDKFMNEPHLDEAQLPAEEWKQHPAQYCHL
jgi:hypothetical protein